MKGSQYEQCKTLKPSPLDIDYMVYRPLLWAVYMEINRRHLLVQSEMHKPIKYDVSKLTNSERVSQVSEFKRICLLTSHFLAKHVIHDISVITLLNICRDIERKANN